MATKVCFDVDGTLIGADNGKPRHEVIDLYRALEALGCEMHIWSGGGEGYANTVKEKLGLGGMVVSKGEFVPDIAVDDMPGVTLGRVTIKV